MSAPTPADHIDAIRSAVGLVKLAELGDPNGFLLALHAAVAGPEDAGALVHGLVELLRFSFDMDAIPRDQRLAALEGMVAALADADPGATS